MKIYDTKLKEVKIIEYEKKTDSRGFSYSIFDKKELLEAEIYFEHQQERIYYSEKAGTLYGIHFQNAPKAQTKLLYCIAGRGIDYAVDLRKESSTYLQWVGVELSAENHRQIYIPKGFGHVFLSLEDHTKNVMRFDEAFDPKYNRQIAYDDPQIHIEYPIKPIVLAEYDRKAPNLENCDIHIG
ncbi:dTDP-4-dehydrorhamnose 3,5-epimerase family protein [Anaerosporobacter faecicola]|uniref:dTDP-4-dehydrorhamnose 3,5-epimerase family protein n=1 Tax=Anaerosporobacter faecicola TaxID=2718714 RepID=UPI00143C3D9C|nr:dTDP-4-dehydrorhamnose 3,5-epimerase family protein [Anaerosporobacter faecicola]